MTNIRTWSVAFGLIATNSLAAAASWPQFPYGRSTFDSFIGTSFNTLRTGKPVDFYRHMDVELQRATKQTVDQWIAAEHRKLVVGHDSHATRRAIAADAHKFVKRTIRKFSLDRGFEFANTVRFGERQCFLQSVVIAGLLQRIGMEAGVVMVWKNPTGGVSNLGHACNVVPLDAKTLILVDASDPEPFNDHQGLFSTVGSKYAFYAPVYRDHEFQGVSQMSGSKVPASLVEPLGLRYLESMFDYYRGERVPGGILVNNSKPEALNESIRFLARSVALANKNPLATYQLARALDRAGRGDEAKHFMERAVKLYEEAGWMPDETRRNAIKVLGK